MPFAKSLIVIFFQIFSYVSTSLAGSCKPENPHPTLPGSSRTWHLEVTGADLAKARLLNDPRRKTIWSILHDSYAATAPTTALICRAKQFSTPLELGHPYYKETLQKIIQDEKNQSVILKNETPSLSPAKTTIERSIKHPNTVRSALAGPLGASLDDSVVHSIMHASNRVGDGNQASLQEERLELLKSSAATKPRVMSRSIYFDNQTVEDVAQYLKIIDNIIVVASAGNEDVDLPIQLLAKNGFSGVIAGSLDINGTQMQESNYTAGERVIYAPGREVLAQSAVTTTQIVPKAGTSIAAPLISGSLINAFSINEDLTAQQMREILNRTTISIKAREGFQNADPGPEQINSYKLYRVAERLLELSKNLKSSFSEKRISQVVSDYIKSPSLYDFSSESEDLIKKANALKLTSCKNKMDRYHLLREAFFLNPIVSTQLQLIDEAESAGLETTALYFSSFRPTPARK